MTVSDLPHVIILNPSNSQTNKMNPLPTFCLVEYCVSSGNTVHRIMEVKWVAFHAGFEKTLAKLSIEII